MITHSTRFQIPLGLRFMASDLALSHPMTVVLRNIVIPFPLLTRNTPASPYVLTTLFCPSALSYSKGTKSVATISFASNPFGMKPYLVQRSI